MSRFFKSAAFPILIVVVLAFFAQRLINPSTEGRVYTNSQFDKDLAADNVKSVLIKNKDNTVTVTLKNPPDTKHEIGFVPDNGDELIATLERNGAPYEVKPAKTNGWVSLLTYVLPFLIFIGFWIFLMNQVQGGGSKVMSF